MMEIAAKAAVKVGEGEEYLKLKDLYQEKIEPNFISDRNDTATGFTVFEGPKSVIADTDYELFYIRNEEGEPYFTPDLVRSLRIQVPTHHSFEEDPFLRVRAIQDRDVHASAANLLRSSYPAVKEYFAIARHCQGNDLAENLGKA